MFNMPTYKSKTVKLFQSENLQVLKKIPDNHIDLTITSPPYDHMKKYKDTIDTWTFDDFMPIAQELFRITKEGGCVVWVVGDATIKGSETGSSFRQALFFKEIGFNIFDTMIFVKQNPVPMCPVRQTSCFEYMFVLSKNSPQVFNPRVKKKLSLSSRSVNYTYMYPKEDSKEHYKGKARTRKKRKYKLDTNIWQYTISKDKYNKNHPASFPIELALDHILTWTDKKMRVLDPFMGSGTVGRACIMSGRSFIGIERVPDFFELSKRNIKQEENKPRLFATLDDTLLNGSIE